MADIQSGITKGRKLAGREVASVPYLRVANVQRGYLDLNEIKEVEIPVEELDKYRVIQRDLLITEGGDWDKVGRTAIWADELPYVAHQNHVFKARIFLAEQSELWLERYLNGPVARQYFAKSSKQTTNLASINKTQLRGCLIAIPQAEEKERIVTKVDELMTLCDQLEQQTEASLSAHTTLVENLLATLTSSANAEELKQNWQRIASHFTTLFTTEVSIDQLKQTILQLAVMGKLVPQDPNDEPAAKLLERIAAEKAQLVKEGKIKKQKSLPPITEDEKAFELPRGWEWRRFSEVVNEVATGPFGSMIHKSDYIEGGVPLINPSHMLESKIVEDITISINPGKAEELKSYKLMPGDIVMARRGEMGRCALVTEREESWLCSTGSFVLKFNTEIDRQYLLLLFKTSWVREYLGGNSVGSTMTNLNHGILNKMPLLLPSLAEQHRIVTKVNQLTTLCDQTKTHLQHQQQTRLHLADAVVDQALNPTNPNSTTQTKAANP